jgi:hypothetical protein
VAVLTLAMVAPMVSRPAAADVWRCSPSRALVCDAQGCQQIVPSTWLIVDFDQKQYQRCDKKGCDSYPMDARQSGIFVNVIFLPGALFKAAQDGSGYVEVATLWLQRFLQFGSCSRS